jgi:nicotinate-nucleotide--dimethylbenzimidazole phosphoribosyltransferase
MRLGEGTGAVALIPLLDMAVAVYAGMITYGDIGL